MSLHTIGNGFGMTRRQALRATGKAIAGAMSLTALTSLPGNDLEAEQQQRPGLPQRGPSPTPEASGAQKLRISTCQFPVGANIAENAKYIQAFMHHAAGQGAHLLHTSEGALSGYGG